MANQLFAFNNNCSNPLTCGLLNLKHAKAATLQIEQDLIRRQLNTLCVTEPYETNGHVVRFTNKYTKIYGVGSPRAAIILYTNFSFVPIEISRDIIAINLTVNNIHFIFISVYCLPSEDIVSILQKLESIIEVHQDSFISINGEFNAKSSAWGPTEQDERGKALLELVFRQDLVIGNDIYSAPTFDSERGKSWIDLTLTKNISREVFKNWVVQQDVTASDHNLITYEITYEKSERSKNK
ncbi:hypothetical protein AVEN_262485-1 [Araneus ventricosus]|uniref:Endonuclease/exonuclease/phosphatase domain-containing protein n=1 Tax=Araneus ventricosus TaxID=182803 RepID=A0A4Y2D0I5_ARAVE|nr:hypothetical protein AVEN_262485-1 [Araneus ventricosus]